MKSDLVRTLQQLDFTEYEAKAYLALLEQSPLTGYGVARLSGVPRSKVYEVLKGLIASGAVLASHGDPTQHGPLPSRELIALRRREAEASIREAEVGLSRYASSPNNRGVIWDITGREEILRRVREVVSRAEQRVLLQLWTEDAPSLRDALAAAAERDVEVVVIAYGDPGYPFAQVYLHEPGAEQITKEYGGRWVLLSIDAAEIVAGIVSLEDESWAAWSHHPGLVMPITEQIKHHLYIAELLLTHREVLEAAFGPGLVRLRERFGPQTIARVPRIAGGFPGPLGPRAH
ncbi:MAG: TrmB family transcriptional regulator [Chloroflexia bacterium]|nr:TrmB family transcriptional regulator [Chloroflexia bacterium]